MSSRRFESIKPVLDARLADDTKEVVTDGNRTYKRLIAEQKLSQGNHGKELKQGNWTTTQTVENALVVVFFRQGTPDCAKLPDLTAPESWGRAGLERIFELHGGKRGGHVASLHVHLIVDRRMPLEELDCDLGPPRPGHQCNTPPLLDLGWRIFDGTTLVKNWSSKPIRADAWSEASTSCLLGDFEGKRNGNFTLELNVRKDTGRLKDLHSRVQIVKNPGYSCWKKRLRLGRGRSGSWIRENFFRTTTSPRWLSPTR